MKRYMGGCPADRYVTLILNFICLVSLSTERLSPCAVATSDENAL